MRKALSLAAFALLLAATGGILVIAYDGHQDLSALHGFIVNAGGALRGIEKTTEQLRQTIAKLNTTADTVNDAADAQKNNLKTIGDDAAKTGTDTRRLVAHLDRVLTRIDIQTLGQLEAQIAGNGNELQASIKTLGLTIGKVGDSADGLTETTKALTGRIADPRIDEIIGHFNTVSGSLDKISVDAVAMSGDMRIDIHRMSQPPSKLHTALNVAWTTAKFGSLFIP
jgi:methyl-accepting chemotaxis protein